jgi:hypothetical protein
MIEFEPTVTVGTIGAALGIMGSIAGSVFTLGWKMQGWLKDARMGRMNDKHELKQDIIETANRIESKFNEHETKDQERHEQNLRSFSNIDVRLARMGNGQNTARNLPNYGT